MAEAPSPKKPKTAAKRTKKALGAEENANSEDEKPITTKKGRRGKQVEEVEDQAMADKEAPVPNNKTKRSSRKPASSKVMEDSEEETATPKHGKAKGNKGGAKKYQAPISKANLEEHGMGFEESIEDSPKAKKGRKKAPVSTRTAKSRAKNAGAEAV